MKNTGQGEYMSHKVDQDAPIAWARCPKHVGDFSTDPTIPIPTGRLPMWAYRRLEVAPVLFDALADLLKWADKPRKHGLPVKLEAKIRRAMVRAKNLRD